MMKKLIALLTALFMCSILTLPSHADEDALNTYDNTAIQLLDAADSLTTEEEDEILFAADSFAKRSDFNVAIVITDDIGEDKSDEAAIRFSENMYNSLCGEGSDGILLFINNDTKYDYAPVHGKCESYYNRAVLADIFTAIHNEWSERDLKSACLLFIEKIGYYYDIGPQENTVVTGMAPEDIPSGPIGEDIPGKPKVKILDEYNYLTPSEEQGIITAARSFSDKSGFNIIFAITDEIGSDKSDRGAMNYADDRYDELCGINTDGILLLINNDTKYDWISTSGSCINYYSDDRIDRIFDRIYDDIVAGDYYSACIGFVDKCESYYDQGKANNQIGIESGDGYIEFEPAALTQPLIFFIVFTAVISGIIYSAITAPYKLKKAVTTRYTVPGSLLLTRNITQSRGIITTRIYSPRSSGSSGGSSRGHSSTHRSSSGGRHGGGGRRR